MSDSENGNTMGSTEALKKAIIMPTAAGSNLMIAPNVKTTATIERTISLLDAYFKDLTSVITSGLRTPEDQLNIIIEKVERHKIDQLFQEFIEFKAHGYKDKLNVDGQELYWWQRAWSKLLNINEVVNPPLPAEVLFDYFRPGSNVNKKGRIIDISNHMKGKSFDIGGASDLKGRVDLVRQAAQDGKCYIQNYLVEEVNNAIHCDCVSLVV